MADELVAFQLALDIAIQHVDSLGYDASGAFLREIRASASAGDLEERVASGF